MKRTLVIGASENVERYSNKAIQSLRRHHHEVEAIGLRGGKVLDVTYGNEKLPFENIDTVTLYINPTLQETYYDYIISLAPKRVIFNPGTENEQLARLLKHKNIEPVEACTLVLLATGQF
jgi:predicted CoA-binding protein